MVTVIAHRGASAAAPENTIEAFRLARELGADWVELDVRRTADGVVVVHHDAHLADGRMVGDLAVDDLPEHVPSLAEALEACEGMGVNIEIKNLPDDPDFDADHLVSAAVAGLVAAYLGPERSLVTSFNVDAVDSVAVAVHGFVIRVNGRVAAAAAEPVAAEPVEFRRTEMVVPLRSLHLRAHLPVATLLLLAEIHRERERLLLRQFAPHLVALDV